VQDNMFNRSGGVVGYNRNQMAQSAGTTTA
jgi:hypothetical protein